ncbi:hypothetical protein HK100_011654 [Physocladia obscura]|uniref:Disease resistance R13L4/SHOC-2-like LRR domain-containing protein n=1 Tax=Physocladia obscura TaxID=109957 RepID=A0AAD5T1U3_9FUNG|nr:hypothetical protein HK100_011654 [Physocladia obscura]
MFIILTWLRPKTAFRLKRVSKYWAEIISIPHFAIVILNRIVGTHTDYFASNTEFDELFFRFPPSYRSICAQKIIKVLKAAGWSALSWCDLTLSNMRLPPEIGLFHYFNGLHIINRGLVGSIPGEIGLLVNLQCLDLARNQLDGALPVELGLLVELRDIVLYGNLLTGLIPREIGNLTRLVNLFLCNNQLSGEIPCELGKLTQMRRLRLDNNRLSGNVPIELHFGMTMLEYADLRENAGLIKNTI